MPDQLSDALLRADIREMGRMLGDAIRRQWGEDFLDLVEEVRTTTRSLREEPNRGGLQALIGRLTSASLPEIERLVRSFTLYFHIANTAEQHHRIAPDFAKPAEDVAAVLIKARAKRTSIEDLREFYQLLQIRPVFTAHPTEVARRAVLSKLQAIDATRADWREESAGAAGVGW